MSEALPRLGGWKYVVPGYVRPMSAGYARSEVANGGDGLQIRRVAE